MPRVTTVPKKEFEHFDYRERKIGITEAILIAEQKFGYRYFLLSGEGHGPCPDCGTGHDRFVIFDDGAGGYWCRQCGTTGYLLADEHKPLSRTELLERRVAALERQQQETQDRLDALERIASRLCDVEEYKQNLLRDDEAMGWWLYKQGVSYKSMRDFQLGYCKSCPTAPGHDSFTIPYFYGGKLINIRHRLHTPSGGKYRPHMAGLGISLFQEENLDEDKIVLLEGEVKSIVFTQIGIPSVAIMGCKSFDDAWVEKFANKNVTVALDPDADEAARELASKLKEVAEVRIAAFPVKPDDMVVKYGGTAREVQEFIRQARPA